MLHIISNAPALGGTPANTIASAALDFTGVDLIVIATGWAVAGAIPTVTDSNGNVYNYTGSVSGSSSGLRFAFKQNPIVTASMTFQVDGVAAFPVCTICGFSGAKGGLDAGKESGNAGSAANITTGSSGTPSKDNSVIITAIIINSASAVFALNNSPNPFTIASQHIGDGSNANSIAVAYELQNTATARNADWVNNFSAAAYIAVFLPTATLGSLSWLPRQQVATSKAQWESVTSGTTPF